MLTLSRAMKDELLAEQLNTIEDDEIIYVYRYGRIAYFCEVITKEGNHSFLVPSMFMDAYIKI
jgi:hypothetical protein